MEVDVIGDVAVVGLRVRMLGAPPPPPPDLLLEPRADRNLFCFDVLVLLFAVM